MATKKAGSKKGGSKGGSRKGGSKKGGGKNGRVGGFGTAFKSLRNSLEKQ